MARPPFVRNQALIDMGESGDGETLPIALWHNLSLGARIQGQKASEPQTATSWEATGMSKHLAIAWQALTAHLQGLGFDAASIKRIAEEDLCFLATWVVESDSQEELNAAEAVIAFAFGFGSKKEGVQFAPDRYDPKLYKPGKSNEGLAEVIVPFANRGMPVFAQWEVAEALKLQGILVPDRQIARPGKEYLGTSGVLKQFLANGLADFRSVILVAHPHHMFRCRETAKTIFRKEGVEIKVLIADTRSVPYDPESMQLWTRSLKDWVEYEVRVRFNCRHSGKM